MERSFCGQSDVKVTPFVFLTLLLITVIQLPINKDPNFTHLAIDIQTLFILNFVKNCALNSDLFRCNIIDSPLCSCGKAGDSYHYIIFFTCTQYSALRNYIFMNIAL